MNILLRCHFKYLYPSVFRYYDILKKNELMTISELERYQLENLNNLITHCRLHSPFYRSLWNEHNVPEKLRDLSDFDLFPTVTKEMLDNANKQGLIVPNYLSNKSLIYVKTTGSTGNPFKFPIDRQSAAKRMAVELRSYDWYRFDFGSDRRSRLWRSNYEKTFRDRIRQFVYNQDTICIYDPDNPIQSQLSERRAEDILDRLNRFKPKNIDGFVSALTYISKYILDRKKSIQTNLKSVVTGAEYLSESARKLIMDAFNVPVYNRYGGTESGLIAHETYEEEKTNHFMHISSDTLYAEVYRNEKPVYQGEGKLVFTDFSCYSFPFVKYINGDVASIDKTKKSDSKYPFSFLCEIKGRINDYFILPNGQFLSSHIWHNYFRQSEFIKQFQIVQEDIENITVNYVIHGDNDIPIDKYESLKRKVDDALPGCKIRWEKKDEIISEIGGKFRHSISKVPHNLNSF